MRVAVPNTLADEVMRLISEHTCVPASRIQLHTTLFGDLGVDGDDASELLAAFAERFHVDLSDFPFDHHFGGEGFWPHQVPIFLWRGVRSIRGDEPHEIGGVAPIQVRDLVHAAERGRWMRLPRA